MNDLVILAFFLLLVAFLLRVDFIYYIVYVALGVYIWGNWYTPRSIRFLIMKRSFQNHAFVGESVTVKFTVNNKSRLPVPWVELSESIPVELRNGPPLRRAISLGGRKSREFDYQIRAMKRGYYRIGPLSLTAGDIFGFKENRARLEADYMTVYPRIVPITNLKLPSKLPFGTLASDRRIFEDPARPIGVRNYLSGDSLRHINWKVSAHNDKLLVKNFQPAISLETLILLNLNVDEYSRRFRYDGPEWAIVVAASLATHLARNRQAVGLATNGLDPLLQIDDIGGESEAFDKDTGRLVLRDKEAGAIAKNERIYSAGRQFPTPLQPASGQQHLMNLLEQLARVEAGKTIQFAEWMPRACLALSWGVTILAISPAGDQSTCSSLHHLVKAGFNPILLISEPYVNFPEIRERARHFGFPAYHVAAQQDLKTK